MSLNNLFINVAGQGDPLLVLHGWGMDHTIWLPIKQILEKNYTVTWLDLPGYGENNAYKVCDLEQMVEVIHSVCSEKTHIMGWSLGGILAQRLAYLYPAEVNSLILVATSPAFVQKATWQHAMSVNVLDAFAAHLEIDRRATLKRFLSLQFIGVSNVQAMLKLLREVVVAEPSPTMNTLRTGLMILKAVDLRKQQSKHKRLWLLGKIDKLVPYQVGMDVLAMNVKDQLRVIEGAGHAPFVSHPMLFTRYVIEFLHHV